jgi:hypothetical protein
MGRRDCVHRTRFPTIQAARTPRYATAQHKGKKIDCRRAVGCGVCGRAVMTCPFLKSEKTKKVLGYDE